MLRLADRSLNRHDSSPTITARPCPGHVPAARPPRWRAGIVGLGQQACADHLPAVTTSNLAELVAVCDCDPAALDAVGAEYDVSAYQHPREMLTQHELDFVVVSVPHHVGGSIIRLAAEQGVHVLKEKPFAISLVEARELTARCAEGGIEAMVAMQRRFNPIYTTFPDLLDRIGRPYHLQAAYTLSVDPADGWRGQTRLAGGGCLLDMGYHVVDMLLWYFGMPHRVLAQCSATARPESDYDAEDTATLTLGYDSGLVGTVLLSRCMAPKTEMLRVTGTDGAVVLERDRVQRLDRCGDVVESLARAQSWPSVAVAQVNHFCRVLAGERANASSPEAHLAHAALIDAGYSAAAENRILDPQEVLA